MMFFSSKKINVHVQRLRKSVWLFPVLCAFVVLLLTAFKISGSSIGIYHGVFYGSAKDSALLAGTPREIRSDEWLTNTQMTLAQKQAGFPKINQNIGDGQNMAIILDVPYKDWSTAFKPHNWAFFVLPFGYALAFKWWLMAFLLVTACYFFVLLLMPGKRLFASLFSIALLFSPFIQWWYQFITLGPIYYSLFLMLACAYLVKARKRSQEILLGAAIAYLLTGFVLVLYPPFQIACGLVAASFIAGYCMEKFPKLERREILTKLGIGFGASLIAGVLVLAFLHSNSEAITATRDSAYPGHRVVLNGGFDDVRLLTSNLAFQSQFMSKAPLYYFPTAGIANQSEASNFLYLMPFLVLPGLVVLTRAYKHSRKIDWPLLLSIALFGVFMLRLFFAHLDGLFRLLLLESVPHNRLLIGTGFLGVVYIVLLVRNLSSLKKLPFNKYAVLAYSLVVYFIQVVLGMTISHRSPGFMKTPEIFILALPFAVITYLLLVRKFTWAALGLLAFSVFSAGAVHPLYRGTSVLTDTPLSQAIQQLSKHDNHRWVTEETVLENYAVMNGARSLSGTYSYPQLGLWRPVPGANADDYNRFAHVDFLIDKDASADIPTSLTLRGGDNFVISTEACSGFIKKQGVGFILTEKPIPAVGNCSTLIKTIRYPNDSFYIYKLH